MGGGGGAGVTTRPTRFVNPTREKNFPRFELPSKCVLGCGMAGDENLPIKSFLLRVNETPRSRQNIITDSPALTQCALRGVLFLWGTGTSFSLRFFSHFSAGS
jgi:hypothetical protein